MAAEIRSLKEDLAFPEQGRPGSPNGLRRAPGRVRPDEGKPGWSILVRMCGLLKIDRSGCCVWLEREPSNRELQDWRLTQEIRHLRDGLRPGEGLAAPRESMATGSCGQMARLTLEAMQSATLRRRPCAGPVMHSDHGCQHISGAFRAALLPDPPSGSRWAGSGAPLTTQLPNPCSPTANGRR